MPDQDPVPHNLRPTAVATKESLGFTDDDYETWETTHHPDIVARSVIGLCKVLREGLRAGRAEIVFTRSEVAALQGRSYSQALTDGEHPVKVLNVAREVFGLPELPMDAFDPAAVEDTAPVNEEPEERSTKFDINSLGKPVVNEPELGDLHEVGTESTDVPLDDVEHGFLPTSENTVTDLYGNEIMADPSNISSEEPVVVPLEERVDLVNVPRPVEPVTFVDPPTSVDFDEDLEVPPAPPVWNEETEKVRYASEDEVVEESLIPPVDDGWLEETDSKLLEEPEGADSETTALSSHVPEWTPSETNLNDYSNGNGNSLLEGLSEPDEELLPPGPFAANQFPNSAPPSPPVDTEEPGGNEDQPWRSIYRN